VLEGTVPVAFLGFGVDFLNSDVHIPCAQDARTSVRCNVSTQWGNPVCLDSIEHDHRI
jgi:hypothetical protein